MRRKKAEEGRGKSLKTLLIFCFIVFLLVSISLAIKAFAIIKVSKFDGSHRFTLALSTKEKSGVEVLSFDPKNKTISVLRIKGRVDNRKIGRVLATYIDGDIVQKTEIKKEQIGKKLFSLAMSPDVVKTNITFIDLARLSYFVSKVADKDVTSEEIELPQSETQIDRLSGALFEDSDIVSENMSIEIVNATGVFGFGGRLERTLSNMGAQVVSVSTALRDEDATRLQYAENKSYTVEKLQRILNVQAKKQNGLSISDIKIILGKSSLSTEAF